MKTLILAGICSLFVSTIAGFIIIPILKKLKAGQPILKYVEKHKNKNGTPTMGGLFFISSAVLVFFLFGGVKGRMATVSITIGLAFMLVGFLDDFIKIKFNKNEGLKAYQKILFQIGISIVAGVFSYTNGITVFFIPFLNYTIDLNIWAIPVIAIIFIAVTNSVNLTDGLDGLAGNVSISYLVWILVLMCIQIQNYSNLYTQIYEYDSLKLVIVCFIGAISSFLIFNTNKAKVFMGDTGSLAIGGIIASVSIFSLNSFFIPIIGIMFVVSSISVIVQVAYFKKTKKRIFLMAPLHHHFQLKGCSETQISYVYSLITCFMGAISVVFFI